MKDILKQKKRSKALELGIRGLRIVAEASEGEMAQERFHEIISHNSGERMKVILARIMEKEVSKEIWKQLYGILENAEYDHKTAAREADSGLFLELHELMRKVERNWKECEFLFPISCTSILVGVDGSRQSYMAFDLTCKRLLKTGDLHVVHVDESQESCVQMPYYTPMIIVRDYQHHIKKLSAKLQDQISIQCDKPQVGPDSNSSNVSIASRLLQKADDVQADIIVIGTVGRGGPGINQIGHVAYSVVKTCDRPVLLVPPTFDYLHHVPLRKAMHFLIGVDHNEKVGRTCLRAARKLMRSYDRMTILHLYKKSPMKEYDQTHLAYYVSQVQDISDSQPECVLHIEAVPNGFTLIDSLQECISVLQADVFVLGIRDVDGTDKIGYVASEMLASPRCNLVVCPNML